MIITMDACVSTAKSYQILTTVTKLLGAIKIVIVTRAKSRLVLEQLTVTKYTILHVLDNQGCVGTPMRILSIAVVKQICVTTRSAVSNLNSFLFLRQKQQRQQNQQRQQQQQRQQNQQRQQQRRQHPHQQQLLLLQQQLRQ